MPLQVITSGVATKASDVYTFGVLVGLVEHDGCALWLRLVSGCAEAIGGYTAADVGDVPAHAAVDQDRDGLRSQRAVPQVPDRRAQGLRHALREVGHWVLA